MNAPEIVAILEEKFPGRIKAKHTGAEEAKPADPKAGHPGHVDPHIVVEPADLPNFCRFLRDDPRLQFDMLNCITGTDFLETEKAKAAKAGFEPHLEVLYHLSSIAKNHRFAVKVLLPRWKDGVEGRLPQVPSVVAVWPAADWHERETYDMCGVEFVGHPDLRRILLSEDWDGFPLRKDYVLPLEYHGIRGR